MNKRLIANVICCACLTLATAAEARTSYDGPWNLAFITQRGSCDPTYTFAVNINDGVVTHPNLVKFRGYVGRSGAVRASVTVHDKYASGSGRLTREFGPRDLERPRRRWALLGILDRATKRLGRIQRRGRALMKPIGPLVVVGLIVCACLAGNPRQRPCCPDQERLLETAAMVDASRLGVMEQTKASREMSH